MVARVNTVAFQGIEVIAVDVQVQMAAGLPADEIAGYTALGELALGCKIPLQSRSETHAAIGQSRRSS